MRISFRQGIVTTPSDFLQPTGTRVDLVLAPPTLITVAFADGTSDYLHTERAAVVNAWVGPFASGTDYWLYWDLSTRTGVRTFGHTVLEPVQGATAPVAPVNDQHWFDTVANKMKVWNSTTGQWVPRIRVFAGKLDAGTTPVSMSVNTPAFTGSQISALQSTAVQAGALVFDINGDVVKRSNNVFFTTEDVVSANISTAAQIKLGAVLVEAVTVASIPAYSVVRFVDFHQVDLATSSVNVNGAYGIIEQDGPAGTVVNVAMEGVITNPEWDWSSLPVNTPLYLGTTGDLSPTITAQPVVVATVVDQNTILLRAAIVSYSDGSGGGADLTVEDNGVVVNTATTTINFGTGIDVANVTGGEVIVSVPLPTPYTLAVQEDSVAVETATNVINFTSGLDVTAGVDGEVVVSLTPVAPPTPYTLSVQEDSVAVETATNVINFTGGINVAAGVDGEVVVSLEPVVIPLSTLEVQDDTVSVETDTTVINFGTNLTVVDNGAGTITVNATGGGGGATFDQDLNTFDSVQFVSVDTPLVTRPIDQTLSVELTTTAAPAWISVTGDAQGDDANEDFPTGIAYNSVGELIVARGEGNAGGTFVTKYSAAGTPLWETTLTIGDFGVASGLDVDVTDNSIYVLTINDTTSTTTLVKLDNSGALVWQQEIVYAAVPTITGPLTYLAVDSQGDVVVVGYGRESGVADRVYVSKYNSLGALQWSTSVEYTSTSIEVSRPAIDSTDNIYVGLSTFAPLSQNFVELFKVSPTGTIQWHSTFAAANVYRLATGVGPGDVPVVAYLDRDPFMGVTQFDATTGSAFRRRNIYFQDASISPTGITVSTDGNLVISMSTDSGLVLCKLTSTLALVWSQGIAGDSEFDHYFYNNVGVRAFGGRLATGLSTYSTSNSGEALIAQLPEDGTLSGTYGAYGYGPITTLVNTASLPTLVPTAGVVVVSAPTVTAGTVVSGVGPLPLNTLLLLRDQDTTWEFDALGFGPLEYKLPINVGSPGAVLTTRGDGTVSWVVPPQERVFKTSTSLFIPDRNTGISIGSVTAIGAGAVGGTGQQIGNAIAVGDNALRNANEVFSAVAIGGGAMLGTSFVNNCIAIGESTFSFGSNRSGIIAIGVAAGQSGGDGGDNNVMIGTRASQTMGNATANNIAIGTDTARTLANNSSNNIVLGHSTLSQGFDGSSNVAIGNQMFQFSGAVTASGNVLIGDNAASSNNNLTNCVMIGRDVNTGTLNPRDNVILLGAGVSASTGSNFVRIGNTAITVAQVAVAWTVTSDARDKTDIVDLDVGLDFVNQLTPRKFKLADRETGIATTGDRYGFLAQEIPDGQIVDSTEPEYLKLNETMMIPVLVKAIQDQTAIINDLKARVAALEA